MGIEQDCILEAIHFHYKDNKWFFLMAARFLKVSKKGMPRETDTFSD